MTPLDSRGLPVGYPFKGDFEVTPREVRDLLKTGAILLIDCRTPTEATIARIEGAKLMPLDAIGSHTEQIEAEAGDKAVVVHCHSGGRSLKATMILRSKGINASSMAGGIDLWSRDIDPKVPRY